MRLYNTPARKVEEFKPQNPQEVKIYTCGPTVYDYAHIGNLTTYIYWDLLVRVLKMNNYKVRRVLNLTDVGHLASDADDGEDKMEKGARKSGQTVWWIAEKYSKYFLEKMQELNLVMPDKVARATDYIEEDMELVERLRARGYTYETEDGIYFDTTKFPKYADFAKLDLENLRAGARVEFKSTKRNVSDFAVWKFVLPGEDHAMQWGYSGRPGYPGWHLECSTIIHSELGEPIDIHAGGIDHIPVHHTNEIAQSEAAFGKPLAKYWLHGNFITIDGEKISKSLGNTYTLEELAEKGFQPMDFKLWVLQGHYQSARNFSLEDLAAAKQRRLKWRNAIARSYQVATYNENEQAEVWGRIQNCLNNNLNSAEAFAEIDAAKLSFVTWQKIDEALGLGLIESSPKINAEQEKLIKRREHARQARDFEQADILRDHLAGMNITVLDSANGPIWQYIK